MNVFIFLLLSSFILVESTKNRSAPISPYNDTTCVTFENLRYYNYSDVIDDYDSQRIFSDNYCYGALTYNITKESFDNIIELNYKAFAKYRSFLNLYYLYSITPLGFTMSLNDGCLPSFRNIACNSVFKSCVDNGNGTFYENSICQNICEDYKIRCETHFIEGICEFNSTEYYCAGRESAGYISTKMILMAILLFIMLV